MMISAFDTSCYVFGKLFGRTKICQVSPNKTWEGFVGGVLIIYLILEIYFNLGNVVGLTGDGGGHCGVGSCFDYRRLYSDLPSERLGRHQNWSRTMRRTK